MNQPINESDIQQAIRTFQPDATDIVVTAFDPSEPGEQDITVNWKANDELNIGNFSARYSQAVENDRRLLAALTEYNLPVPKIISASAIEGPGVILEERLTGKSLRDELTATGMRWQLSAIAFGFARALAMVHSLNWHTVTPWMGDVESVPEDMLDEQVEEDWQEWGRRIEALPDDQSARLKQVHTWLDLHRPVEASICLCHGTWNPDNVLMDDEEVTGIKDWSKARVADASVDMALLPYWLEDIGLAKEDAELFNQAAFGAYIQTSPRGLSNIGFYSVAGALDEVLDALEQGDTIRYEAWMAVLERALADAGHVPWRAG